MNVKIIKTYIWALLLTTSLIGFSQTNEDNAIKVLYQMDYKKFVSSDKIRTEYFILINKGQKSVFTFEKMIKIDSVKQFRPINEGDLNLIRLPYFYFINRDQDSISHYQTIGNDLLMFNEKIDLKWNLTFKEKNIGNFKCNKATVNYGGRSWIAWYTTQIPVNTGPYKFFGLPGLIVKIRDTESIFEFTAVEIKQGNYKIASDVKNYFISEEDETFQNTTKDDFFKYRNTFYQMSLKDRLDYMNRDTGGIVDISITNTNGEKVKSNRKPKARNFIERNKEGK